MGKLIVIDGLDGSGKKTQADILYNRIKEMGRDVHLIDFPDYKSDSSGPVRMYLNGEIGKDPSKLNPYMCGLFYTADRAIQFSRSIFDLYNRDDSIIISNRYVSANVIHQGSKFQSAKDKEDYFDWIYEIEVEKVGLPKEDITIVLSVPVEVSQRLMDERYKQSGGHKDIHESDIAYLRKCYDTVDVVVNHSSSVGYNWVKIDCCDASNNIRSREDIQKDIWEKVRPIIES